MRLAKREKRVIASSVVVGLGILAWLFVVSPLRARERELGRHIQEQRERLKIYQRAASRSDLIEQERTNLRATVQSLQGMLLDADKESLARSQLGSIVNRLANKCGIHVTTGYPAGSEAKPTAGIVPVQYKTTFNCDEKQLTKLLVGLADSKEHKELLRVPNLEIRSNVRPGSRAPASSSQLILVVTLTVEGYYKPSA